MVANVQPIFVESANNQEATFVNADGTTPKDLIVAGADGTKIFAINVTSDDTVDRVFKVFLHDGSTAYLLGAKNVPTLSGTDGIAATVNLLDPTMIAGLDSDGELFIKSGYKVQVGPTVAITAAKTATVIALGGDY